LLPARRPSVLNLRVCSDARVSGRYLVWRLLLPRRWAGCDAVCAGRSPESVRGAAVLLPERFRAVLRLRRRPCAGLCRPRLPVSPAAPKPFADYKRAAALCQGTALQRLTQPQRGAGKIPAVGCGPMRMSTAAPHRRVTGSAGPRQRAFHRSGWRGSRHHCSPWRSSPSARGANGPSARCYR